MLPSLLTAHVPDVFCQLTTDGAPLPFPFPLLPLPVDAEMPVMVTPQARAAFVPDVGFRPLRPVAMGKKAPVKSPS